MARVFVFRAGRATSCSIKDHVVSGMKLRAVWVSKYQAAVPLATHETSEQYKIELSTRKANEMRGDGGEVKYVPW